MAKSPKYWGNWRDGKVAQGLCANCGGRPIASRSRSRCEECLEHRRVRSKELRDLRRSEGRCLKCPLPVAPGFSLCEEHRAKKVKRPYERRRYRERSAKARAEVLALYGGQCTCCGEANPYFLTMDHINGDGAAERRNHKGGQPWRRYLRKKRDDLRILCFNCNCGRELTPGKICPHKL
jgi:hypothetical protein